MTSHVLNIPIVYVVGQDSSYRGCRLSLSKAVSAGSKNKTISTLVLRLLLTSNAHIVLISTTQCSFKAAVDSHI